MISNRYAVHVLILLTLTLIPTVIHSYLGLTKDDGVSIKNINPAYDKFTSSLSTRNAGFGEEIFGSSDWVERIYTNEEGNSLRLFIVKGYDHKRLYHHPELALSYGKDLRNTGQIRLGHDPEMTVNILHNNLHPNNSAAFVLLYDGKFIDNPILHQILDSLKLLISAKKPMTLIYVSDDQAPENKPFSETAAASLLIQAVENYQSGAMGGN